MLARVPGFKLKNVSFDFYQDWGEMESNPLDFIPVCLQPPNNFKWETMWVGSLSGGTNAFVNGLYTVMW